MFVFSTYSEHGRHLDVAAMNRPTHRAGNDAPIVGVDKANADQPIPIVFEQVVKPAPVAGTRSLILNISPASATGPDLQAKLSGRSSAGAARVDEQAP